MTTIPPSAHPGAGGVGPYPGQRLGLPESGPRSVARIGRRVGAIFIDWTIASGLSYLLFRTPSGGTDGLTTTVIFALTQIFFVIVASGGIGHLVLGMRVVTMNGRWVGPLRPISRAVLLALVIPALIFDIDQRGLHDRLSGTVLVRV